MKEGCGLLLGGWHALVTHHVDNRELLVSTTRILTTIQPFIGDHTRARRSTQQQQQRRRL